jgi:ATP-dependent DNA helicase RecG
MPGAAVLVSGTLGVFKKRVQFQNPEYEILDPDDEAGIHTGRLFPVYPLTRGLTQRTLRRWVRHALERFLPAEGEILPAEIRRRHDLIGASEAAWGIHYPESPEARDTARRRLVFEELLLDQLLVHATRLRRAEGRQSEPVTAGGPLYRRIRASLPFTLTGDQERAVDEILGDLGRPRPAQRLLQGDVGSGKTVIALLAAAAAADTGLQTAIMAPTELLAEQHARTLAELGGSLGLRPVLLTGSTPGARRREILAALADGSAPLAVGTHALFQDDVAFHALGLVVVDEQHRFGVLQRLALLGKGRDPHVLAMTATPIPRSLAMVRYADLDLSVLRERPRGRGRIVSRVTAESNRDKVYGYLRDRLAEGRQAYVIYPLVEESEASDLQAATTMAGELAAREEFREFTVALLHGQMKSDEKERVMRGFMAGSVHVLVATTVVEVGIDVANAAFMIIEHPERYGLSQLHQLRGRIGRGEHPSYCVLVRGENLDPAAVKRLELFARTQDGFELSRLDLLLRGPGDLLGTRQSGQPRFRVADPLRDAEIIEAAQREARTALETDRLISGDPEWSKLEAVLRGMLEREGTLADAG